MVSERSVWSYWGEALSFPVLTTYISLQVRVEQVIHRQ